MFNKKSCLILFVLFVLFQGATAQDCKLTIKGFVIDEMSQSPLAYVNVVIQETQNGTTTDDQGNFLLEDICPGHFHFIVSHIGCADEKFHFDIYRDTTINITLSHTPISLGTVVVAGEKNDYDNQANLSVNRKVIEDKGNQGLSGILENETGVHLLKNGTGISKPVVHGLFGNRLLIFNNGIAQSGQQWGNDHSPEIDPFASDKITVIKGANALEYGGGNLGSVILTEPQRIQKEPHLHGQVNYIFETNGRGHTVNTRLEKHTSKLAWRINGTLKKYGDKKAANYFLNNTGLEEANFSVQLQKTIQEKLFLEFYASTFNTRLGVLRGSLISNLTDLEGALAREIPFFTEPDFSYDIEAPMQQVSHQLVKGKAKYFFNDHKVIEFVIAGQLNERDEFDIRRGGRSEIPTLSLYQFTLNTDLKYANKLSESLSVSLGHQSIVTDNRNNSGTGIFPLIPNYISYKNGLYGTLNMSRNNFSYNLGLRYDNEFQRAFTFMRNSDEVIIIDRAFNNLSAIFAAKLNIAETQSLGWNIGFATRNPAVNELYSNGLHQGVGGIEEGDIDLDTEVALKNTLEYKWVPNSTFALNVLGYFQRFNDYIFLDPQDEFRLTIRGAFPVFIYNQTDANIYGLDFSTQFTISNSLLGQVKYSYLRGQDRENDIPLVFIAPNSMYGSLTYRRHKTLNLSKRLNIEDSEIEVTNRYVFRQNNLLPDQDFLPPPPAYNLFGIKVSTNLTTPSLKFRFFLKADNLFNVSYRDYLNRQRYFADDVGRSIVAGINLKF